MRLRSILAVLLMATATLATIGCGSSKKSYVATGNVVGPPTTGNLVFHFNNGDSPFLVGADTEDLLFEFFNADSDLELVEFTAFDEEVTVEGVPGESTAVRITGFNDKGIPLYTIDQPINVLLGLESDVPAYSTPVAVSLVQLSISSGQLDEIFTPLTLVDVPLGTSTQVFLFADYSNGSTVLIQDGVFSITPGGESIATVSSLGRLHGHSIGTTTLICQYGGQTLSVPVSVGQVADLALTSIMVSNVQPIVVGVGDMVQIVSIGERSSDGMTYALPASNLDYEFNVNAQAKGFDVDSNGVVTIDAATPDGDTGTLTVKWTNPDSSVLTAVVTVMADN